MQTTTVEITLSEDLLSLGLDKEKIQEEVEKWLVLSLFREGKISSGEAGSLLGIGRRGFLNLLDREGIAHSAYIGGILPPLASRRDARHSRFHGLERTLPDGHRGAWAPEAPAK